MRLFVVTGRQDPSSPDGELAYDSFRIAILNSDDGEIQAFCWVTRYEL